MADQAAPEQTSRFTVEQLKKIAEIRCAIHKNAAEDWRKWRLVYAGGTEFVNEYLKQYSKRETGEDYSARRAISYNANHAKAIIKRIRNAIAVKLPDVVRDGDQVYLDACKDNIDNFRQSMATWLCVELLPSLLTRGRAFAIVDAPAEVGVTKADTGKGHPYVWVVNAEDALSLAYDAQGRITKMLVQEKADDIDDVSGLPKGTVARFRHMELNERGTVWVTIFNEKGEVTKWAELQIDAVPVAEFVLADSLLCDIADMQIALLNLASTDMSFLFRGNFPLWTEQEGQNSSIIPRTGTKAQEQSSGTEPRKAPSRAVGAGQGVRYPAGAERPGYVAPQTENLKVSMEKQAKLAEDMNVLADLALTSLSIKALQQSGASKEADRVGEEAGLAYIGTVLEAGEREIASIFHKFLGQPTANFSVSYPSGYSLKTSEDRQNEAKSLKEMVAATVSPKFQKEIQKRIAQIMLKPVVEPALLRDIEQEIDKAIPMDLDKDRAAMIRDDVAAQVLDTATGTKLRGYPDGTAEAIAADKAVASAQLTAGFEQDPTAQFGQPAQKKRSLRIVRDESGKMAGIDEVSDDGETSEAV